LSEERAGGKRGISWVEDGVEIFTIKSRPQALDCCGNPQQFDEVVLSGEFVCDPVNK
jgi:hypothetical protein